jgi:hypothetical protein
MRSGKEGFIICEQYTIHSKVQMREQKVQIMYKAEGERIPKFFS